MRGTDGEISGSGAGITYEVSKRPRSDLYRDCLPAVNSGRVALLDDRRLLAQFVGLERRTARGGRDSIDHAPGAHDDVVNAACGALVLAAAGPARLQIYSVAVRPWSTTPSVPETAWTALDPTAPHWGLDRLR